MRRRLAFVASSQSVQSTTLERASSSFALSDLKLFGMTYAAGFLFVSVFLA